MDDCCNEKESELSALPGKQKRVLWITLFINLALFVIEFVYGNLAHSTSLVADSLDMLGDAFVYGISLYAIGRSLKWSASISLVKGSVMLVFGLWAVGQAIYRFVTPSLPVAETMGWVGGLALIANLTCAALLLRFRNADINMRSTWLCSRNDVIANIGVLIAAGLVALTNSRYPDLVVGITIAGLVLSSSFVVLKDSFTFLDSRKHHIQRP